MMISPLQLKRVFPTCRDPNAWVRVFTMELPAFAINTPLRVAAWVAQCGYESQGFNTLRESGSYGKVTKNAAGATVYDMYSEKRLMAIWPSKFPTLESTQPYIQNPEGLLNYVYANRDGNGPPQSRDGTIYRGGGLIQLTGRANYREVGNALGIKLEAMPKLIEQPNIAARTSAYFWKVHDLNTAADAGDFAYITKKINAGLVGETEREAFYAIAKSILAEPAAARGFPPGAPVQVPKPTISAGPLPGSVPLGTQDGLHTPGGAIELAKGSVAIRDAQNAANYEARLAEWQALQAGSAA